MSCSMAIDCIKRILNQTPRVPEIAPLHMLILITESKFRAYGFQSVALHDSPEMLSMSLPVFSLTHSDHLCPSWNLFTRIKRLKNRNIFTAVLRAWALLSNLYLLSLTMLSK